MGSGMSELPDGWTSDPDGENHMILRHPEVGYVTIDWERRGFRSGVSRIGNMVSTKTYAGRGWRQQLQADAVSWLSGIWDKREGRERKEVSRG